MLEVRRGGWAGWGFWGQEAGGRFSVEASERDPRRIACEEFETNGDNAGAVLRTFVVELLRLLLRERASIINRVAISEFSTDPTFACILASRGRAAWS